MHGGKGENGVVEVVVAVGAEPRAGAGRSRRPQALMAGEGRCFEGPRAGWRSRTSSSEVPRVSGAKSARHGWPGT